MGKTKRKLSEDEKTGENEKKKAKRNSEPQTTISVDVNETLDDGTELENEQDGISDFNETYDFSTLETDDFSTLETDEMPLTTVKVKRKAKTTKCRRKSKAPVYSKAPVRKAASQLAKILKEFLGKHEWEKSVKILYALTHEPDYTAEIVWQAGYQLMCNHPNATPQLFENFAKAMIAANVYSPAIVLESVIYFLRRRDLEKAIEVMQIQAKQCCLRKNERRTLIDVTLQGYEGLLLYMKWKKILGEIQTLELKERIEEAESVKKEAEMVAGKACSIFEKLFVNPGGWDMFINKYVKVMEYYKDETKAMEVIKLYCETNPLNTKAYIFQLDFLQKHFPNDKPSCLHVIKVLSLLDPSEVKLLDISKYIDDNERKSPLLVVFNMVDFTSRRHNLELWCYFANIVSRIIKAQLKSDLDYMNGLWEDRKSWWPSYHFNVHGIEIINEDSAKLYFYKVIVFKGITINDSTDLSFVKKVNKKIGKKFEAMASQLMTIISFLEHPHDDSYSD